MLTMELGNWTYLFGAAGQLMLAVLCFARGRRSPVARPLAFLCLTTFGWCFTSLSSGTAGKGPWNLLDTCLSELAPVFALHLTVTFVGVRRTYARALIALYASILLLVLSCLAGFVSPTANAWAHSKEQTAIFLLVLLPALVIMFVLLVRHLRAAHDPDEKARTRMMLAGFLVYATLATNDELIGLGVSLPHLAPIGALLSAFLLATAVFRFRLFDRDLSASTALYTAALAIAGVVAYFSVLRALGGSVAAVAFGTIVVMLALGAAAYEWSASAAAQRAQVERLVALGRFSSQMAHDFKNPLATIKGSLQFLQEERAQGRSLDAQTDFLRLMLDQVGRLERVADEYERLGRVEPICRTAALNPIIENVVALEPFAAKTGVEIHAELAPGLPPCELDADLLSRALQNLIRNALEAMPKGGKLTVRTALGVDATADLIIVSVEDQGEGMDPRQAERAFDEFYTTKPTGSGLGLAFVRRVARAHGGDASLSSRVGVGTIVEMRLPLGARG
jgi:two-component system, NtrC family, sensor histidine kinase HydH